MTKKDLAVSEPEVLDSEDQELSDEDRAKEKLKKAIKVKREDIGALRVKLTVTVPRDTIDERMGDQFAELKRDAEIPGFRKGHAPLRLVEKRFASDVGDQLINQLISNGYLAAIEKENLKPLGDPLIWVKVKEEREDEPGKLQTVETEKLLPLDQALTHMSVPKEGKLSFSAELELKPEFDLPKLTKIPVSQPKIKISDDDVESEIKRLLAMRGTFGPVEKGAVKIDDMLYVDMKMSVDGKVIESEDNFDIAARDVRVKGVPLIGLGDSLVGAKRDDVVTFDAKVPDDHENIDIREKKAKFEFAIREIKRLELPKLDKTLLSQIGFDSEKELRKAIRSKLEFDIDSAVKRNMREQVGDYLIDQIDIDIPEGLSQRQTDRSVARRLIELYQSGYSDADIEKAKDKMQIEAHDQVVRDLKLYFILEKVAEDRNIEVGEEQINGAIAQIAQRSNKRFDRVRDELSKGDGLMSLYLQIRDEKVLESLLKDADVSETDRPKSSSVKRSEKTISTAVKKTAKTTAAKATKKTVKKTAKKTTVKAVNKTAKKAPAKKKTTKKK